VSGDTDRAAVDQINVLGSFSVVLDGRGVDPSHWRRRSAASLVKALALAPDRRLHREQVIEMLWPEVALPDAAPRLHKAVHFARRALGADALDWMGETLSLFPTREVEVDVVRFESAARAALHSGDGVDEALELFTGELLPDDRYESWTEVRRNSVSHLHRQLMRVGDRWLQLLAADPTDEQAHVALMRAHVERGDRAAALSQYEQLTAVLAEEIGVEPGDEAAAVREAALALPPQRARDSATPAQLPTQDVRFCHAADLVRLAYAVEGSGPPLVKAANWLSHLEYDWESMLWRHWLLELTSRYRVLRYDERGCGLSDWNTTSFNIEAWIDDLATVVDAAGFERFPLLGISQGAAVAVEYAARHPDRVSALVLYGGYVHGRVIRARTDEELRLARLMPELAELGWGRDEPTFRQVFTARFMPEGTREQWDEFNELQRLTTSATNAARFLRGFGMIDVTDAAQRVTCPTLVVHVRGDLAPPLTEGRLLASLIPGSRFVSLEGHNHLMLANEPAWPRFVDEMNRFLAEVG
jgi:DNA-binding SARP family transcriptional activator/pimeloyl-ACP methyl ester carboxylesterase